MSNVLVDSNIIYAEVSIGFDRIEDLEEAMPPQYFLREALPWNAAFLAGKCFRNYRSVMSTILCHFEGAFTTEKS